MTLSLQGVYAKVKIYTESTWRNKKFKLCYRLIDLKTRTNYHVCVSFAEQPFELNSTPASPLLQRRRSVRPLDRKGSSYWSAQLQLLDMIGYSWARCWPLNWGCLPALSDRLQASFLWERMTTWWQNMELEAAEVLVMTRYAVEGCVSFSLSSFVPGWDLWDVLAVLGAGGPCVSKYGP